MVGKDQWVRRLTPGMFCWGVALGSAAVAAGGCIDGFKGSDVQIDFSPETPAQVTPGGAPGLDQLPNNVHLTLYAIAQDKDGSGNVTTDHLFQIQQFEIHPVVDLASPCFIDVGVHAMYPGLHVSQFAARVAKDTGIADVANPPAGATQADEILAATADQRETDVQALAGSMGIRAITSTSTFNYGPIATGCVGDPGVDPTLFPPPSCMDDASNALRLAMCQAAWAANPTFFEGTDTVLSEPLDGTEYGVVDGLNPVNEGPVGGSEWFVPDELAGFDAYAIYWQYDDADGDGVPDYPPTVPLADQSVTGQLLTEGVPEMLTRGVDHVHMTSQLSPLVFADMAIFANLDQDSTNF